MSGAASAVLAGNAAASSFCPFTGGCTSPEELSWVLNGYQPKGELAVKLCWWAGRRQGLELPPPLILQPPLKPNLLE